MKMRRFLYYLMAVSVVMVSMTTGLSSQEKTSSVSDDPVTSTNTTPAPFSSFRSYPDHSFHSKAKEYTHGMQRGGHNFLIWRDLSVNLSQYSSAKITEFGGRLLPRRVSYDTSLIALFNSMFCKCLKLPQRESPDALLIVGEVVECNPGNQAARIVPTGAGKAAGAVVCEVYEPGKTDPCIRIYMRDTAIGGIPFGGNAISLLSQIFNAIAIRLADTLNNTFGTKSQPSQLQPRAQPEPNVNSPLSNANPPQATQKPPATENINSGSVAGQDEAWRERLRQRGLLSE